jgi:hypothetical protein
MKGISLVILLILFGCLAGCVSDSGVRVYVTNQDTETINMLNIYTSFNEYQVEDIAPGQTKEITIRIKGKTKVLFMADSVKVLGNSSTFLAPIRKGVMRIVMTKEAINSSITYRID